jgi:ATP phosphoribosyltransferase regulatory subunit HisZ
MNLKIISNQTLLEATQKLVLEERKLNLDILHHLKEIELRKLHLELGFSSLFEYTVQSLGYSEDAAYRRISAMRLMKSLPQIEEKIASGSLSFNHNSKGACRLYDASCVKKLNI